MICNVCGEHTSKHIDIDGGIEYSSFECDACGYIQNKIATNPSNLNIDNQFNAHISNTQPITGNTEKSGFVARILTEPISKMFDKYTPPSWKYKQNIISKDITPSGSGLGYIFSPYVSLWTQMWGVTPIADLAKYRLMYRTVPKIKRGVDKTVASAIIKGFNDLEIKEQFNLPKKYKDSGWTKEQYGKLIIDYVNQWIENQSDFGQILHMVASDMLIYGNAYLELVYEDLEEQDLYNEAYEKYEIPKQDFDWAGKGLTELVKNSPMEQIHNPEGKFKLVSPKGKLLWLKPLDPLYMRVRSDAYGNVFGYLQFLSVPPIAYTPEKMAHFRYAPKSWQYEIVNGTSVLMSLIRTQDIIWQIENDLILLGHATVKPPVIFSCGTVEDPWTKKMFDAFIAASSTRGPGGDVFVRGDVKAVPLPAPTESIAAMVEYLGYHDTQRTIALGVPPQLLGQPEGSSRTTAEVSLEDWINILQNLQTEIGNILEDQIFRRIVEMEFGEGAPIPSPIWNELFDKNENDTTSRIISMKQASIISVNEARTWLAELNIDMDELENGDDIPELEMSKLQLEEMEINNENLKNPPVENQEENSKVEASDTSMIPSKFPNVKNEKKEVVPVNSLQRNAEMTDPGVGDSNGENQLMYPGFPKNRKKKGVINE